MLSPDEVNDLLEKDPYEIKSGTEGSEILVGKAFDKLIDEVGPDLFRDFIVQSALDIEDELRATRPEHPVLAIIDEWREEQKWK